MGSFIEVLRIKLYKFKMSLKFYHPYSIKPCYFRRKPINMDFDELSIFPYFFNSCLDDLNLKLQNKNQNEDNENNFVTKIKLKGFEPKDINLELSSDKRKIKITAKNENKIEKDGFRSYSLNEFSKEISLPENIDVDKLKAVLDENDDLVIIAPKILQLKEKEQENEIRIQMEPPKYQESKNVENLENKNENLTLNN